MAKHIHIHVGTRDASPDEIKTAQRAAEDAVANAISKVSILVTKLTDRDDKSQADSARRMLRDALGKLENEVLSGRS